MESRGVTFKSTWLNFSSAVIRDWLKKIAQQYQLFRINKKLKPFYLPSRAFSTVFQPTDFLELLKISSHKVTIWTKDVKYENRKRHFHDMQCKIYKKCQYFRNIRRHFCFQKWVLGSRLVLEKCHVSLTTYFNIEGRIHNIKKEVKQEQARHVKTPLPNWYLENESYVHLQLSWD